MVLFFLLFESPDDIFVVVVERFLLPSARRSSSAPKLDSLLVLLVAKLLPSLLRIRIKLNELLYVKSFPFLLRKRSHFSFLFDHVVDRALFCDRTFRLPFFSSARGGAPTSF